MSIIFCGLLHGQVFSRPRRFSLRLFRQQRIQRTRNRRRIQNLPADDDGIIPLAAEEWLFDDDATSLFRDFVKTVWGEKHLQENLDFVAESLCLDAIKPKKNESSMETIRRYFSTQFYKDHLKTYKNALFTGYLAQAKKRPLNAWCTCIVTMKVPLPVCVLSMSPH